MNTYTTRQDAIAYAIEPALGEYADQHDLDAIFEATFAYDADAQAFVQTADDETFWAAVEANAL